jgi:hypothetical protein
MGQVRTPNAKDTGHLASIRTAGRSTQADDSVQEMHEFMASYSFDHAASLMSSPTRSSKDDATMLFMAQAALHHAECHKRVDPRMLVAASWQVARVHYELGNEIDCALTAAACLQFSEGLPPIFNGYALDVISRAEELGGRLDRFTYFRQLARGIADANLDAHGARALQAELDEMSQ